MKSETTPLVGPVLRCTSMRQSRNRDLSDHPREDRTAGIRRARLRRNRRRRSTAEQFIGDLFRMKEKIRVAIAGVGNCASALVQGVEYYHDRRAAALEGVMRQSIGGYSCGDV